MLNDFLIKLTNIKVMEMLESWGGLVKDGEGADVSFEPALYIVLQSSTAQLQCNIPELTTLKEQQKYTVYTTMQPPTCLW